MFKQGLAFKLADFWKSWRELKKVAVKNPPQIYQKVLTNYLKYGIILE